MLAYNNTQPAQPRHNWPLPTVVAIAAVAIWLALRVALWFELGPATIEPHQSLTAFVIGEWFDVATLGYVIAPLLLFAALLPDRWRGRRVAAIGRQSLFVLILAALIFESVAEYVFWMEFTTRFNFIASWARRRFRARPSRAAPITTT